MAKFERSLTEKQFVDAMGCGEIEFTDKNKEILHSILVLGTKVSDVLSVVDIKKAWLYTMLRQVIDINKKLNANQILPDGMVKVEVVLPVELANLVRQLESLSKRDSVQQELEDTVTSLQEITPSSTSENLLKDFLAEQLAYQIKRLGLTQQEAAKRIGLLQDKVSNISKHKGKALVSEPKIVNGLVRLGCDVEVVVRPSTHNEGKMVFLGIQSAKVSEKSN